MHDFSLYRRLLATTKWQCTMEKRPSAVANWLDDSHSLTQKLQQICPDFSVSLVWEGWQAAAFGAKYAKSDTNSSSYWQRDVLLWGKDKPWVFAQTFLPKETIDNVAQAVLTLGNQPIGLWLFPQQPQRLDIEWQYDAATGLYARRSPFLLKGYPLEIRELFLADFPFEQAVEKA